MYVPKLADSNNPSAGYYYWKQRETANWDGIPKLYDDDCEAFY